MQGFLTGLQLENNKAPDLDNIKAELMKCKLLYVLLKLADLVNVCWKFGHTPEHWRLATVTSVFKKGNRFDCNNYRSENE